MNTHLSEQQISKWIAGACTAEEERHGRECAECQMKLVSFQSAMSGFRTSIVNWADQLSGEHPPDCRLLLDDVNHRRAPVLRWVAVTAAAAVILGSIPAYRRSIEQEREANAAQESQLDTQLLQRVNAHLSQVAPASLQPLMEMQSSKDLKNQGDVK